MGNMRDRRDTVGCPGGRLGMLPASGVGSDRLPGARCSIVGARRSSGVARCSNGAAHDVGGRAVPIGRRRFGACGGNTRCRFGRFGVFGRRRSQDRFVRRRVAQHDPREQCCAGQRAHAAGHALAVARTDDDRSRARDRRRHCRLRFARRFRFGRGAISSRTHTERVQHGCVQCGKVGTKAGFGPRYAPFATERWCRVAERAHPRQCKRAFDGSAG